jgi:GNAT superfamily N-acetyltransferase
MRALCASEPGCGVLAFVGGHTAGWCSVAPKSTYRALVSSRTIPHVHDEGVFSVARFVVRPAFRRRGLTHELLEGAVGHAHAMGATALEGYPVDPGGERVDQTSGYVGTVGLFEAHGFRRVSDHRPKRRQAPLAHAPRASLILPTACFPGLARGACARHLVAKNFGGLRCRIWPTPRRSGARTHRSSPAACSHQRHHEPRDDSAHPDPAERCGPLLLAICSP